MLKNLKLENFKTWQSLDIEFAPITGLFGTNSSGKSSILQFLLMLKQTREENDRNVALSMNGRFVELGAYESLVHDHNVDHKLKWNVELNLKEKLSLRAAGSHTLEDVAAGQHLSIASCVGLRGRSKAIESLELRYALDGVEFALTRKSSGDGFELACSGSDFRFVRNTGRVWQIPGPVKSYAFPDQTRTYFQNSSFLSDLEIAYEKELDSIFYLGPLRDYPSRDYFWSKNKPSDVGKKGERAIEAILAATESGENRNAGPNKRRKSFQEIIAYWLREIGVIDDFRVEEIAPGSNRWQVSVIARKGGAEALLTDVGFGVSQVLPVITLLQYVPENSTVILEQPEIHLHPLAQANLADAIINAATHRNVQVILESHSEHLLLRLQRRIAEGTLSSESVNLFFCEGSRNVSRISELDVDMFGRIGNWPKNFMGDAFGETSKAEIARLKRQIQ
jgi:predicted ATPase